MTLRRITLATTLIPLLSMSALAAEFSPGFADDTANIIRGVMDDVHRTHTEANCANGTPDASSCIVGIGYGALLNATTMNNTIAIGRCSGATLTSESRDLLIGDYTSAPKGKDGFVNLENKLCFWRDAGATATCPPPEPECITIHDQPKDTK